MNYASFETEKSFILENALDAVVGADQNNAVIFWNKNAEIIFGWKKEEIIGRDLTDMIVPAHLREGHRKGVQRFIETGIAKIQNQRIEIPGLRKSGEIFDMELTVTSVKTPEGYRFYSFMRDVTEQKAALAQLKENETRLRESETNLRGAIDSSAGGFYGVDREGVTTVCNSGFLTMLGFTDQSEVLGRKLHDVIHHTHPNGDHYPKEECPIYKAASLGAPAHVTNELFFRIDGTSFPVEYWTIPLIDNGELKGAVTTFIDISERIAVEAALRAAKDEADKANQLKSAFLANMSHEIRTPLGAMLGFADLLGEPGLTAADRANYIDILNRNGTQLNRIINDILDLSKVETGHVNFEYLKIDPLQIAHEVVSLMSVLAKERGISLTFTDDGTTPPSIVTDPTRAKQVLMNLVNNSLKFTKVGSIRITLSGYQGKDGSKCCAFEVIDTGVGIPQDSIPRLFKMFSQADNSMTRRYGGTGLGLALSRSIARAMGGDVRLVKSAPNRGSTFHFSIESREELLPMIADKAIDSLKKPDEALPENSLENIHVLLVEDSPDNQQLIWHYLSKHGATVDIADNGLEGVTKALLGEHDIVLMDLQMPIMDGYTAVGKLRSKNYGRPIIALTAHAMSDVRKKCQDVGCNDHLPKPINPRDLIETILRYGKRQ